MSTTTGALQIHVDGPKTDQFDKQQTNRNRPMIHNKLYTSLLASNIMAKLTNRVQRTRFLTTSTDKHYSIDSEDDFRLSKRQSPTTVPFRATLTWTSIL